MLSLSILCVVLGLILIIFLVGLIWRRQSLPCPAWLNWRGYELDRLKDHAIEPLAAQKILQ